MADCSKTDKINSKMKRGEKQLQFFNLKYVAFLVFSGGFSGVLDHFLEKDVHDSNHFQ